MQPWLSKVLDCVFLQTQKKNQKQKQNKKNTKQKNWFCPSLFKDFSLTAWVLDLYPHIDRSIVLNCGNAGRREQQFYTPISFNTPTTALILYPVCSLRSAVSIFNLYWPCCNASEVFRYIFLRLPSEWVGSSHALPNRKLGRGPGSNLNSAKRRYLTRRVVMPRTSDAKTEVITAVRNAYMILRFRI